MGIALITFPLFSGSCPENFFFVVVVWFLESQQAKLKSRGPSTITGLDWLVDWTTGLTNLTTKMNITLFKY